MSEDKNKIKKSICGECAKQFQMKIPENCSISLCERHFLEGHSARGILVHPFQLQRARTLKLFSEDLARSEGRLI
jgi:hypothetical protein